MLHIAILLVLVATHIGCYSVCSSETFAVTNYIEILMLKLFALAGFWIAFKSLKSADYLWKAWLYMGISMYLYILKDLVVLVAPYIPYPTIVTSSIGVFILGGNVFNILGLWRLSNTWSTAGLDGLVPKRVAQSIWIAIIVVVGATTVVGMERSVYALVVGSGSSDTIINLTSGVGDTISLLLLAPMIISTLSMGGGKLQRPWRFLCLMLFAWLGADASLYYFNPIVADIFRICALMFGGYAGLAYREVVMHVTRTKKVPTVIPCIEIARPF